MTNELNQMQRAVNALRLELPAEVVDDIQKRFDAVKQAAAALTRQGDETAQGEWQKEAEEFLLTFLDMQAIKDTPLFNSHVRAYVAGRTAEQKGEGEKAAEFWQNAWSRVVDLSKERKKTIAALHQQINDLKEQLQSSRVVYQDPDIKDVKVTEADQAEYEAGMHRHFREKYAEALERILELEAENKRLREAAQTDKKL
jgi:hypothetical protein